MVSKKVCNTKLEKASAHYSSDLELGARRAYDLRLLCQSDWVAVLCEDRGFEPPAKRVEEWMEKKRGGWAKTLTNTAACPGRDLSEKQMRIVNTKSEENPTSG